MSVIASFMYVSAAGCLFGCIMREIFLRGLDVSILANKVHIKGMTLLGDKAHEQEPQCKWLRLTQPSLHKCQNKIVWYRFS